MWDQSFQVKNLITRQECTEKHNVFQNKTLSCFFCLYVNLWHFWWLHMGEMIVFLESSTMFVYILQTKAQHQLDADNVKRIHRELMKINAMLQVRQLILGHYSWWSNLSKSILVLSHLHCCFSAEGKWNSSPTRSSTSWTRESSARCWEAQSHNWYHYW